jgi:hypothetical protein
MKYLVVRKFMVIRVCNIYIDICRSINPWLSNYEHRRYTVYSIHCVLHKNYVLLDGHSKISESGFLFANAYELYMILI